MSNVALMILIGIIMLFIFTALVIPAVRDIVRKNRAMGNQVENHNPTSTEFLFAIPYSKKELDQALSGRGAAEGIEYRYDKSESVITLRYAGGEQRYALSLEAVAESDKNLLRVIRKGFPEKSYLPYLVNVFFINRLDAVPIPYFPRTESVVCE